MGCKLSEVTDKVLREIAKVLIATLKRVKIVVCILVMQRRWLKKVT